MRVFRQHPPPNRRRHKNQWHEEQPEDRQQAGHVLQLATHDNAPLRINRMVDKDPKKRARANREEEHEREEIGKRELLRLKNGPDGNGGKGDQCGGDESKKPSAHMLVVEHLRRVRRAFAHGCFCASSAARSAAGTSLIVVPPWDFCRARR